jgi:2-oxoglutarate ferredoxin oxidoreductase subunit gamma
MRQLDQIRFAGIGGQGLVLAGMILGHAAIKDKRYVAGSDFYGVKVRGGYALSDVVISDQPIVYPHIIQANILVSMAQDAYEDHINELADKGVVIYDKKIVVPNKKRELVQFAIAATSTAVKDFNQKQTANIIMLGALIAIKATVTKDSLLEAIEENVPAKYIDINLRAVEAGYQMGIEKCL